MVASQEENRVWKVYFNCIEKNYHFNRERPAIHKIAEEQVFCGFRVAADFQKLQEIIILAKNLNLLVFIDYP
jgi:hypothetical protein